MNQSNQSFTHTFVCIKFCSLNPLVRTCFTTEKSPGSAENQLHIDQLYLTDFNEYSDVSFAKLADTTIKIHTRGK